jgi:hypothetical protein
MTDKQVGLRIDLGCGSIKKEGTLGIDFEAHPEVDYVLDLASQPFPFRDRSVVYAHSSHFLEHIQNPTHIFAELSRVCADKAKLEFWTPYAWSNSAFILDHKLYYTEDIYLHMCCWYVDFWSKSLGARWIINEFQYVIDPRTLCYLKTKQITLDFALRHLHNVANEFCAYITVHHEDPTSTVPPPIKRTFSTGRFEPRYGVQADPIAPLFESMQDTSFDANTNALIEDAIRTFAAGPTLPPR